MYAARRAAGINKVSLSPGARTAAFADSHGLTGRCVGGATDIEHAHVARLRDIRVTLKREREKERNKRKK